MIIAASNTTSVDKIFYSHQCMQNCLCWKASWLDIWSTLRHKLILITGLPIWELPLMCSIYFFKCGKWSDNCFTFQWPNHKLTFHRPWVWKGVYLFRWGQLRHAQVQPFAKLCGGVEGVHRRHRLGQIQLHRLHQLEPVLHSVQARRDEPLHRGNLIRQHRPGMGRHLSCKSQENNFAKYIF